MDAAFDSESNSTMNSQEDQSLRELALRDLARSRQVEQALLSAVTWDLVDSLRAAAQLAAKHGESEMQACLFQWAQTVAEALGKESETALAEPDCTEPESWFG